MDNELRRTVQERVVGALRAVIAWALALPERAIAWTRALPGRAVTGIRALPSRLWQSLLHTKRAVVGADPEPGEVVVSLATVATLTATVAAFLGPNELVAYPLVGFLAVTGVGWATYQARMAKLLTLVMTVATVLTVGCITYFLFSTAYPLVVKQGLDLFIVPVVDGQTQWFFWLETVLPTGESFWSPANKVFSMVPLLWATILVTLIAGAVAGPLGILGALFIAEVAGDRTREFVKPAVEILAGIPSIVYGFIGVILINDFFQTAFLDQLSSFLAAGLVVGVMALPTVVSVAEDALSSVPGSMRDGSAAMGATEWQTMKSISVPAAFSGISAAIILGLGRAIGETMAVAAMMGSGARWTQPLFDVFDGSTTLTSRIATSYGTASAGSDELRALFVAGVILFVIVAGTSVLAQYIERRMRQKLRGQA